MKQSIPNQNNHLRAYVGYRIIRYENTTFTKNLDFFYFLQDNPKNTFSIYINNTELTINKTLHPETNYMSIGYKYRQAFCKK